MKKIKDILHSILLYTFGYEPISAIKGFFATTAIGVMVGLVLFTVASVSLSTFKIAVCFLMLFFIVPGYLGGITRHKRRIALLTAVECLIIIYLIVTI